MTALSVADRLDLADLVDRYAALVDDRDHDALGALFTPDAVLRQPRPPKQMDPVDEVVGRAAIAGNFARLDGLRATQHAVVGKVFTAGSDGAASGRIACIAHHVSVSDDRSVDHAWHLTYEDVYRRTDGVWQIAARTLRLGWIEKRTVGAVRAP
ncbi:nuclear transport factor 2 family protein [Tomitella fengzijianii]|uniref:Nuclear transport factor 2 family protein n=1 Tax=Tomitella fengzijianii TaxID=2597660 RepID=A0A516X705_9ACTN|nr:nuclear transport factor 2 family protein [Tomitella fengzijianii]QDQ98845.1 nuclear transport factor 2 family protein [Tomitella fengzijianii]